MRVFLSTHAGRGRGIGRDRGRGRGDGVGARAGSCCVFSPIFEKVEFSTPFFLYP